MTTPIYDNMAAVKLFGKNLRHFRETMDLSQGQLAVAIGNEKYYSSISSIEIGHSMPSPKKMMLLADALGVEPWEFFAPEDVRKASTLNTKLHTKIAQLENDNASLKGQNGQRNLPLGDNTPEPVSECDLYVAMYSHGIESCDGPVDLQETLDGFAPDAIATLKVYRCYEAELAMSPRLAD